LIASTRSPMAAFRSPIRLVRGGARRVRRCTVWAPPAWAAPCLRAALGASLGGSASCALHEHPSRRRALLKAGAYRLWQGGRPGRNQLAGVQEGATSRGTRGSRAGGIGCSPVAEAGFNSVAKTASFAGLRGSSLRTRNIRARAFERDPCTARLRSVDVCTGSVRSLDPVLVSRLGRYAAW
jgi:hypothetical protein